MIIICKDHQKRKNFFNIKILLGVILSLLTILLITLSNTKTLEVSKLFGRYSLFYDPQVYRCIPQFKWYLVDFKNTQIERNALYLLKSPQIKAFATTTTLIKYVSGISNDLIEINHKAIYVNGREIIANDMNFIQEKFHIEPKNFYRKFKVEPNEIFVLGTSNRSFDSRYWGTINEKNILGRAYPIW